MNKKFVYEVGNNKKKLYHDARPTKYQDYFGVVSKLAVNRQWRYNGVWINISYCVGIAWKT
jgi:hypothetical protein